MIEKTAESKLLQPKAGNSLEWGYIPPVTSQEVDLHTDKYDNTPGVLENARINTVPIPTEKGNLILMQTVRYDLPQSDKLNLETRNRAVIIGVGGGGSGAIEGIGWIRRTADAIEKLTTQSEPALNITSIVTVSHPQGAARQQDTINKENLHASARLILDTLIANENEGKPLENDQPRILDADVIIIWGASAGGGVAIELARLLEQAGKKYKLVLVDPAATSSHPKLMQEVTLGNIFALLNYFKFLSQKESDLSKKLGKELKYTKHKLQLLAPMFKEVLVSMTTPEGAPDSLLGLIQEMAYKGKVRLDKIAREHGLELSEGGIMQDISLVMQDTTKSARNELHGDVLLVSPVFSPMVNLLIARKGFTKQMLTAMWGYHETGRVGYIVDLFKALKKQEPHASREELLSITNDLLRQEFIDTLYCSIATELFPHAQLQVMAEPSGLHSGISRTQAINRIVEKVVGASLSNTQK